MIKSESIMKILHIGLMVNGRNEGLSKAFRQAATLYAEFPPNRDLPLQINRIGWVPDIVFLQIQDDKIRHGRDTYDTNFLLQGPLSKLKEKGAFVINWTGDKRHNTPQWMLKLGSHISCTAFSNMEDVRNAKAQGINSAFLQIGIDPEVFNDKYPKIHTSDIVFMANNHGHYPLSRDRMRIVQTMQANFGQQFVVYGHGYPGSAGSLNANGNDPFPMQSKEAQIYRSCKIGLSVSHFQSERYTSDRLLRIMGSGCFALSHHFPGIEDDFQIGKHLDVFHNDGEMINKCKYYLENEEKRIKIAKSGHDLIHENHTYKSMVQDIIKLSE